MRGDRHVQLHVARSSADASAVGFCHAEHAARIGSTACAQLQPGELDAGRSGAHRNPRRGAGRQAGAQQPARGHLVAGAAQLAGHIGRDFDAVIVTGDDSRTAAPAGCGRRVVMQAHVRAPAQHDLDALQGVRDILCRHDSLSPVHLARLWARTGLPPSSRPAGADARTAIPDGRQRPLEEDRAAEVDSATRSQALRGLVEVGNVSRSQRLAGDRPVGCEGAIPPGQPISWPADAVSRTSRPDSSPSTHPAGCPRTPTRGSRRSRLRCRSGSASQRS